MIGGNRRLGAILAATAAAVGMVASAPAIEAAADEEGRRARARERKRAAQLLELEAKPPLPPGPLTRQQRRAAEREAAKDPMRFAPRNDLNRGKRR